MWLRAQDRLERLWFWEGITQDWLRRRSNESWYRHYDHLEIGCIRGPPILGMVLCCVQWINTLCLYNDLLSFLCLVHRGTKETVWQSFASFSGSGKDWGMECKSQLMAHSLVPDMFCMKVCFSCYHVSSSPGLIYFLLTLRPVQSDVSWTGNIKGSGAWRAASKRNSWVTDILTSRCSNQQWACVPTWTRHLWIELFCISETKKSNRLHGNSRVHFSYLSALFFFKPYSCNFSVGCLQA